LDIKKLITLAETAKQAEGDSFADKFLALTNRTFVSSTAPKKVALGGSSVRVDDEDED